MLILGTVAKEDGDLVLISGLTVPMELLVADDQCHAVKGEPCAFNALQRRAERLATGRAGEQATTSDGEDEAYVQGVAWFWGSKEKCCRCKNGTIGWSVSGVCSFCKGKVKKKKSVTKECKKSSKGFLGNTACAKQCEKYVFLMEVNTSGEDDGRLSVVESMGEEETFLRRSAKEGETDNGEWPWSGTTEKCCRCRKDRKVGWSASGGCSFCNKEVLKKTSVTTGCRKGTKGFLGSSACAKQCSKYVFLLEADAYDAPSDISQ